MGDHLDGNSNAPVHTGKINQIICHGPDQLTTRFTPAAGWLCGSFRGSGMAKAQLFRAVLLQKQGLASGAYATTARSGRVVLEPPEN